MAELTHDLIWTERESA